MSENSQTCIEVLEAVKAELKEPHVKTVQDALEVVDSFLCIARTACELDKKTIRKDTVELAEKNNVDIKEAVKFYLEKLPP